ncbi:hypothetical protein [Xanthobacter flavus]|uniref:hypothetical protein n=1 Tax=Xanthobacter flavus TaxID=281 RepID=UPI003727D6DE
MAAGTPGAASIFLLQRFRRPDGLFRNRVTAEGAPLDESVDLDDHAFALFAFAQNRPAELGGDGVVDVARIADKQAERAIARIASQRRLAGPVGSVWLAGVIFAGVTAVSASIKTSLLRLRRGRRRRNVYGGA